MESSAMKEVGDATDATSDWLIQAAKYDAPGLNPSSTKQSHLQPQPQWIPSCQQ
jgi:hypothetical protein